MKQLHLNRREFLASGAATSLAGMAGSASAATTQPAGGPVEATWESLAEHYQVPDWFADAKFGIWAHWGAQCQPEWGDWYARLLYLPGKQPWFPPETAYDHH